MNPGVFWGYNFFTMEIKKRIYKPIQVIPLGFLAVILCGTILLMLPVSTYSGSLSFFDAFFEAVSATCVTGLIVVDTATTFTFFGQLVLLVMIQLGGVGFMSVATFIFVTMGKKISLKERMTISESLGESHLQGVIQIALNVLKVTFSVELCGALLLMTRFIPLFGFWKGLWMSIFTSISAFCNAGFDLMGNYTSLTAFVSDPIVNLAVCLLIIIGGLGFGVLTDLKTNKGKRKYRIQTKVVLYSTPVLIFVPSVIFLCLEYHRTMEGLPFFSKVMAAVFQSVTCRTAGFNTIDQLGLSDASKLLSVILMFIGGSSAGTAGGIKITTVAVIFFSTRSLLNGKDRAEVFERWISKTTVIKAFSIFFIALSTLMGGLFLVSVLENGHLGFINQLYELTSAIATVGLSVGLSGSASIASRAVICLMMFMGRVGILTIPLAIGGKKEKPYIQYAEADIMVG